MSNRQKIQLTVLVLLNYFVFMMIGNIIGVLLPNWQAEFDLSKGIMTFLGAAFFLAYGLTSLPQGILFEKLGSKKTFLYASILVFTGSLLFALKPTFVVGLISLFIIGTGVTALQMVGNLLVKRIDEDPQKYSRNLTMSQVFCGLGAMSGAFLNSYFTDNFANFHWTTFYYIFAVIILILGVYAAVIHMPDSQEKKSRPAWGDYVSFVLNPQVLLFALGIFIYVGIEVGIANWIKVFMTENHAMASSACDKIIAWYWGLQSVGRFTGGAVLNYISNSKALILYALLALACLLTAIFTPSASVAGGCFMAVGFFTSIMFPTIYSLAINNFSESEDLMSGVLCTAIVGGAVTQVVIGQLAAPLGGLGMSLAIISTISFVYIAFIGLKNMQK